MITLIQDLRYAWRTLLKIPGFTAVAVLTLALGIGANTAVFSVLDAVVLRPLPYPQPDKLVSVQCRNPRTGLSQNLSYPDFFDFRGQNHVFEHLVTYRDDHFTLTGFGQPRQLNGELVTWNLFGLLGIQPALGRGFLPSEEAAGTHVAVLSHELWQRQFGGDRGIVGRNISGCNPAPAGHALRSAARGSRRFRNRILTHRADRRPCCVSARAPSRAGGSDHSLAIRVKRVPRSALALAES